MAELRIRCAFTSLGNIEAAIFDAGIIRRVEIDGRTGDLVDHSNTGYPHSDLFRQLLRAARQANADRR